MAEKVLSVNNLVINFKTDNGILHAVRNVSFDLERGETLCIVGESGSGKSVTSKAIMGILARNAIIENGSIMYRGENLLEVSEEEFYKIRGHKIGMIFQDPLSSLNPIVKIGKQITEAMLINSDQLKLMYQDLISDDLIAYKNNLAKRDIKIANIKKSLEAFTKDAKKEMVVKPLVKANIEKEINEKKAAISELSDKASGLDVVKQLKEELAQYTQAELERFNTEPEANSSVKSNIANKKKEISAKCKVAVQEAKANSELQLEIKEQIAKIQEEIAELKKGLVVDPQIIAELKQAIANKKAESVVKIAEAKKEAAEKEPELKAKLVLTQKEAKLKVKEYKAEITVEHNSKMHELKLKLAESEADKKAEINEQIKQENIDFQNKIKLTKAEAKRRALEIMREVGIPEPEKRFKQYPFEFSGGMRQRIVIAIALTAAPEILICDEPTTALDVTIQAQILELINRIKKERNLSCIFITHDLGVVANMADRVAVMYAGKIVEYGTAEEVFFDPRHPYTWALLSSIPDVDSKERLDAIPGTPPNMIYPPKGDAFALRSKYAMEIDFEVEPPMFKVTDTHYAGTWLLDSRAPKVEMPKIVSERIRLALEEGK